MKKPNNYDNVSVSNFIPVILGGHRIVIKDVKESLSKNGKPMAVVFFDFTDDDSQPRYFSKLFADDIRPEKKWPHTGTKYIVTEDNDGNCSKSFKQFTTAFESSNNTEVKWGPDFGLQFKGKVIGGVFGEVENEYNGKVTMRHELRWFCDVEKADGADIPAAKYLNGTQSAPVTGETSVFAPAEDEELPFN